MKPLTRTRRAFTMLELLVTITILAILAALVTVDYSNIQRNSRDSRRRTDVQSIATAVIQYSTAKGTTFLRHGTDHCTVPAVIDPNTLNANLLYAGDPGCVGANGLSFGKVNLANADTDGYGTFDQRRYRDFSIIQALTDGGFLASPSYDPQVPKGPHHDPALRDYVLIRACTSGYQNVGSRGTLFAVWTSLENLPKEGEANNVKDIPGGPLAGPTNQYQYDFGAQQAEYANGFYTQHGYGVGNGITKADLETACSTTF